MNYPFGFRSIKSLFTTWFLLVSLLPMFIITGVIYQQRVHAIKKEAFEKLTAIRDLKAEQVESWILEKKGDVKTISEDYEIRRLEEVSLGSEPTGINKTNIKKLLFRYLENYSDYHEIFIVNPVSGIIEISTDATKEGTNKAEDPYFKVALLDKSIFIKEIYFSKTLNAPSMSFSMPIFSLSDPQKIVGVLVARVDLEKSLYAMLLNRVGMGETGETLIVNKDGLALNDLRWRGGAPLNLTISALPAMRASQGHSGIIETQDYRNQAVLAAYTYIETAQWGFVAKQDIDEVYEPITKLFSQLILLIGGAAIIVCVAAVYQSKRIALPIVTLANTARKIQSGELSARVQLEREDELGQLSQSFNSMADEISANIQEIRKVESQLREERNSLDFAVQERTADLREEINVRKRTETTLAKANAIVNRSATVVFLWRNEPGWPIEFATENIEKLTGYSASEFQEGAISYQEIIHKDDLQRITEDIEGYSKTQDLETFRLEPYRIVPKNNEVKWVEDTTIIRRSPQGFITHYESVFNDVTLHVQAEEALRRAHDELEQRVIARTAQLSQKTQHLEEVNTALKVLLRESGELKQEMEDTIQLNIKEAVMPYLDEIHAMQSDPALNLYIDTIKANIEGITSTFSKSLSLHHQNLTPREIQIANCIRQGKTNKDIANLLNITSSAVDFHRRNLRDKLDIKGKKTNLRTHLLKFVG